ncbi:MAG TPA: hypothetical protein VFN78_06230 [Ktedonobacterales bacterium]|nr:hypothetical protein [Ktedonobacterales bacterium]
MFRSKKVAIALLTVAALAVVTGLVVRQASADASTYTNQTTISVAGTTIPYTADPTGVCYGEDINLTSGTILIQSHGTMDQNGFHGTYNVIRQDIHGVGAQSGAQYVETGTDNGSQSQNVNGAFTSTFTDHINIVGQGPDNNAIVSDVIGITVTPDGQQTAYIEDFSITCH